SKEPWISVDVCEVKIGQQQSAIRCAAMGAILHGKVGACWVQSRDVRIKHTITLFDRDNR
ncbi:hypothetical protein, partial [Glaciimonas sp. CA11.2]|uniref:hypothetical protein n=1 Tax=Glaciimonas sp. CA11.2 TaxID=3048601 RepID=UPI002B22D89B